MKLFFTIVVVIICTWNSVIAWKRGDAREHLAWLVATMLSIILVVEFV